MRKLADIFIVYIPLIFVVLSFFLVLIYKWVPVKWTPLMIVRSIENLEDKSYSTKQTWVDIQDINPLLVEAIIAAEDQRFYHHNGFDFIELQKMKESHDMYGGRLRGCSTISQQVAKNCFTFCSRTIIRKVFEAYYTILIEMAWSKERILEVYINIAETGRGLFGVEVACEKYYHKSSSEISISDAVAIACVLPNPLIRNPYTVMNTHQSKYKKIYKTLSIRLEE